jgi:hypothetical protein
VDRLHLRHQVFHSLSSHGNCQLRPRLLSGDRDDDDDDVTVEQIIRDNSPSMSGVKMLPLMFGFMIASTICGFIISKKVIGP